jgi:hypothetical protein
VQAQEQNLDQLHESVGRLGTIAVDINTEIKSQNLCVQTYMISISISIYHEILLNRMLDDLTMDVESTQERMNFVMARMARLLKTKDTCQLSGIFVLTIVLVIMVFLVIYT